MEVCSVDMARNGTQWNARGTHEVRTVPLPLPLPPFFPPLPLYPRRQLTKTDRPPPPPPLWPLALKRGPAPGPSITPPHVHVCTFLLTGPLGL